MILAGVDEAGLGPKLGPLVTASAALIVPEGWRPETPWDCLGDAVGPGGARDVRLAVGDSKVVYKTSGMHGLEKTLAAVVYAATRGLQFPLVDIGRRVNLAIHPCYSGEVSPFPLYSSQQESMTTAQPLEEALGKAGAEVAHLGVKILFEPELNDRFDSGLNKNQALLMETGRHLVDLTKKFPNQEVLVCVDKQGGRNDYLPFLSSLFPGAWIDVLAMGGADSAYRLRRQEGHVTIRFTAKADRHSFTTALASMAAKYARERAMAEFNAWFGKHYPTLTPTAGYPEDAKRWLREAVALGISQQELDTIVRKR